MNCKGTDRLNKRVNYSSNRALSGWVRRSQGYFGDRLSWGGQWDDASMNGNGNFLPKKKYGNQRRWCGSAEHRDRHTTWKKRWGNPPASRFPPSRFWNFTCLPTCPLASFVTVSHHRSPLWMPPPSSMHPKFSSLSIFLEQSDEKSTPALHRGQCVFCFTSELLRKAAH